MEDFVLRQLVRYVKALDLPEVIGLPSNGSLIFSQGNELKRTDINNVVSEIIRANFEIITQTTVVSSTGYRRYRVVEAGSYTMPDGDIIVTESQLRNNFVYIVVDEGVSVLELIPIGVESIIKDWDALEFGLEYPEVRHYNGSIYRVIEGQTTDANETPNTSAKWEAIVQDTSSFLQLINNNTSSIGDLGLLETTNTSDLVSAINELINASSADVDLEIRVFNDVVQYKAISDLEWIDLFDLNDIRPRFRIENNVFQYKNKPTSSWQTLIDFTDLAPTIGSNGNWYVNGVDTGVKSQVVPTTVYDDDISGLRNGVNTDFLAPDEFIGGSLDVYLDGLRLSKGNNKDYTEIAQGARINRVITPQSLLIFEYIKE